MFSTLLFCACKKSNSDGKNNCRIITVSYPGGIAYNFTYNADNKLSTVTYGNYATSFAYNGNSIVSTTLYSGVFNKKETITLNANGLAANVKLEPGPSGQTWGNLLYEYNGEQLIKRTFTSSSAGTPEVLTYNWTNGNNTSLYINGSLFNNYEYYTDKEAQTGDISIIQQFVKGYQSIKNKNLTKTTIYSNGSKENYTYSFDDAGKIAAATSQFGATIQNYNYQYQCK